MLYRYVLALIPSRYRVDPIGKEEHDLEERDRHNTTSMSGFHNRTLLFENGYIGKKIRMKEGAFIYRSLEPQVFTRQDVALDFDQGGVMYIVSKSCMRRL